MKNEYQQQCGDGLRLGSRQAGFSLRTWQSSIVHHQHGVNLVTAAAHQHGSELARIGAGEVSKMQD